MSTRRPPISTARLLLRSALLSIAALAILTPTATASGSRITAVDARELTVDRAGAVVVSGEIAEADAPLGLVLEIALNPVSLACAPSADANRSVATATSVAPAPAAGPFTGVRIGIRPSAAGAARVCAYLWGGEPPITAAGLDIPIDVRTPPVEPSCRIGPAPARLGGRVLVTCVAIAGEVRLRAWRKGRSRSASVRLVEGAGSASARRLGLSRRRPTTVTVLRDGIPLDTRMMVVGR